MTVKSKPCKDCGIEKPFELFDKDKRRKDGHGSYCLDCCALRKKTFRKGDPRRYKFQQTKHKYGVTEQDWLQLLNKQGGHCACCPATEELCVDHCHTTGKVRGLLCHHCNRALGLLRDNPEYINNLLCYVNESLSKTN